MHIERLIPLDDDVQKRVKAKYASKKPLWGRGHGGCPYKKHSDEFVAHIRWLYKEQMWTPDRISSVFGIHPSTLRGYLQWLTRIHVKPSRSIHLDLNDKS